MSRAEEVDAAIDELRSASYALGEWDGRNPGFSFYEHHRPELVIARDAAEAHLRALIGIADPSAARLEDVYQAALDVRTAMPAYQALSETSHDRLDEVDAAIKRLMDVLAASSGAPAEQGE